MRHSAGGVTEDRAFILYGIGRVYAQESCSSVGGQELTHQMLTMMASYPHDCQPRNRFNDMSWKVTRFITKYGGYIISEHIFRKFRNRAIMSNFLIILVNFFN